MVADQDLALVKGLPVNEDAERFVLGSVLLNYQDRFDAVAAIIQSEDFFLEKHRRIFKVMCELSERGEVVDRVTVANELQTHGQLESVDGLSYLISLDEGLPDVANLEAYVRIVQDKAVKRRAIFAHQQFINELLADESESSDVLARSEKVFTELRTSGRRTEGFLTPSEIIEKSGGIQEALSPSRLAGLPTPWDALNEMLTGRGFTGGQLIVIAGRPGSGKTALASNIAVFSATSQRVFFVSLEMSSIDILRRMICARAQVNMKRLSDRYADPIERHDIQVALGELTDLELPGMKILDAPGTSVPMLRSELRREAAKSPIGMVIIDYLQLMEARGSRRETNRNLEIAEISRGLKLLARELNCRMIALSQLSRDSEKNDRRPRLSDLRDSGAIEQDADIVIFPYTQRIVGEMPEVVPYELILEKQRNGPIGSCALNFYRKFTRFAA